MAVACLAPGVMFGGVGGDGVHWQRPSYGLNELGAYVLQAEICLRVQGRLIIYLHFALLRPTAKAVGARPAVAPERVCCASQLAATSSSMMVLFDFALDFN